MKELTDQSNVPDLGERDCRGADVLLLVGIMSPLRKGCWS